MSEELRGGDSIDESLDTHSTEAAGAADKEAPASESRRRFIKTAAVATGAVAAVAAGDGVMHELDLVKPAHAAEGGIEGTPIAEKWWPSRWGEGDQTGATNHMTPQVALDAAA